MPRPTSAATSSAKTWVTFEGKQIELARPLRYTVGHCEIALYDLRSSVVQRGSDPHCQRLVLKSAEHVKVSAARGSVQDCGTGSAFKLNPFRPALAS